MVLAVVGLARDGCLVRSWCRGRAAGGAAGLRARRGVTNASKASRNNRAIARLGGSLATK